VTEPDVRLRLSRPRSRFVFYGREFTTSEDAKRLLASGRCVKA